MDPAQLLSTHPSLVLFSTVAVAFVSYVAYNLFFHPLAGVPGPLSARTGVGAWLTRRAFKHDMGWKSEEQHDLHGLIVRTGRNSVSICDPSAIGEIYRYGSKYEKTRFYSTFKADREGLMSTLDNHAHAILRRAQSPAYTMTLLVELEELVDSCLEDLVGLFDREIEAGKGKATIEMAETLQLLAMDVVGELAFGESFGLCKAGKDTLNFLPMLVSFASGACLSGTQPWAAPLLLRYTRFIVGSEGPFKLAEMTTKCVKNRIAQMEQAQASGEEVRRDMLSKLMMAKNADGSPYTLRQVEVAAASILAAGSDTTAITMRAVLKFILSDPRIKAKVLAEIDEAVNEGRLSFPIAYSDGTKLSYFQACLKETLRLHPAVPWTLPRVVPEGGAVLAGKFFAAGTHVAMDPQVLHRRSEAYGADAKVYRPERWLEADEETKKIYERNLITFGSGSRVCIGKNISLMEITKVLPTLLYRYEMNFTPRSPSSPHKLPGRGNDGVLNDSEPWHVTSQWFSIQSEFFINIEERQM